MSLHVLIVANTSWNIYNFRLNVIRLFIEKGCRVTVAAPVDEFIRYTEEFEDLTHIGLKHLDRDSINPFKDLRLIFELYRLYHRLRPDLVLHYTVKPNIYGGIAAWFASVPSLAVITGLGYPFIHGGFPGKITSILYRISNHFHRRIIFENLDDLELFTSKNMLDPDKGFSIKGCGVDINYYNPDYSFRSNGKVTFTFIGRLLYDKGIREFIEAAHLVKKQNPDVRFWLIGQIDEENPAAIKKSDLVEWVKDPNIDYLGSKEDVRPYIIKSDCIVLPSYREAIARSVTEAMSMAKPVIGTDTAGLREAIVDKVNGYLVEVKNASSLARAMLDFISLSTEDRAEMGRKGRMKVEAEFDDVKIAREIWNLSKDLLPIHDRSTSI